MTDLHTSARKPGNWKRVGADPLDRLVHLSHLMGQDTRLVQPGGGNTSMKEGDTLLVKGSGTDLRTIGREGFTRLSLSRLAELRRAESMSDAEMMRFMGSCMVGEGRRPAWRPTARAAAVQGHGGLAGPCLAVRRLWNGRRYEYLQCWSVGTV